MGQNSSQQVAVEHQEAPAERVAHGKKRKMKKSKRKSAEQVADNINKEETTRVLMQMRKEDVNHVRRDWDEYDLAASSQLLGDENIPYGSLDIAEGEGYQKKRKHDGHVGKKSRKRPKSHGSSSLHDENPQIEAEDRETESPIPDDLGELHIEGQQALDGYADLGFADVNDIPSATLDGVPSDDEDIASFLRGFQQQEEEAEPSLPAFGALEEEHEEAPRSSMPASSPTPHKKRAKESDSDTIHATPYDPPVVRDWDLEEERDVFIPIPDAENADLGFQQPHPVYSEGNGDIPSELGQHTLDIDFQAFDNYCAAYGLGSANIFNDPSEQSLPVDPALEAKCEDTTRARQNTLADSEENTTPHRRKRKSSGSRKLPFTQAKYPPVSSGVSHDPDLLNDEQSDRVLPGLEERQRLSSEGYSSHAQSAYSSVSSESTNAFSVREKASRARKESSHRGRQASSPAGEEETRTAGKFTGAEISKLEDYRDNYCAEKDVTTWQFNDLIQAVVRERPKAKEMWQGMYEIIPYRKKVTIQRFCRRRFHNYQVRGTWSEEDDKALVRAVQEKGNSWVAVAQIMERHPEDVRDRWRNYHVNPENRNKEQWTDVEIRNLAMAIHDCMQIMKDARRTAKLEKYEGRDVPESETDSDQEAADAKLINWQVVSDRMGGTRSRLQCSFKWGKLKDEDRAQALRQMKAARAGPGALDHGQQSAKKKNKKSWRAIRAQKRVQEMRPGDVYDFLHAVSTCQAAQEGNIPWKSLGDEDFRKRWTAADRKAAWAMFKGSVLSAEHFHYQEIVNHLLNNLLTNQGDRLEERWDPDLHGYGQAPPPKTQMHRVDPVTKRQERLQKGRDRRLAKKGPNDYRSKVKSDFFVACTDDEDDVQDIGNQEDQDSITRSSNGSRRSSKGSGLSGRINASQEAAETANTTVDESDEEDSVTQRFSNDLASQLQQSLA